MRKRELHKLAVIAAIIPVIFVCSLHGQGTKSSLSAGEQRKAEKGLKDNRYFFYFINSTVSNLDKKNPGSEKLEKLYKKAIQRDIIAQFLYMKFLFHYSYVEIRRSQKLLIDLYRMALEQDIATTKKLLNRFAPDVVRSNGHKARRYLRLGYRDATVAKTDMIMADNYQEKLYSLRLYKYVRAIKKAKHGKRYAFLAILQANKAHSVDINLRNEVKRLKKEKDKYRSDKKKYRELKDRYYETREQYEESRKKLGYLGFERLKKLIAAISKETEEHYTRLHYDNYYRSKDETSFYDRIWEKPDLEEIDEFKEYLNMQ
ncbi:MAG: hypothetical protein GY754_11125 [bacterium]|nr:hypothetical protein [bacterium]